MMPRSMPCEPFILLYAKTRINVCNYSSGVRSQQKVRLIAAACHDAGSHAEGKL
jgi:hypothetical protein